MNPVIANMALEQTSCLSELCSSTSLSNASLYNEWPDWSCSGADQIYLFQRAWHWVFLYFGSLKYKPQIHIGLIFGERIFLMNFASYE